MIYLASPYSHEDHTVEHDRAQRVAKFVLKRMEAGDTYYSPILHFHWAAAVSDYAKDARAFRGHNLQMMQLSKLICVYCLPGWNSSHGVLDELLSATALNKSILYINPKTEERTGDVLEALAWQ